MLFLTDLDNYPGTRTKKQRHSYVNFSDQNKDSYKEICMKVLFEISLFESLVLRLTWPTEQNTTAEKACKGWINYYNICSNAGLICCTLHLVLLPLVSRGVVTEFSHVWGNVLPIY